MENDDNGGSTTTCLTLTALIGLGLVAHFLFSWIGFTPTDDGFTLAYSRRLLDGEVPHRDFIIIRPFVSPLVHVPEVWLGGQYTLWISRLVVWMQFAVIAWSWGEIVDRLCNISLGTAQKILISSVVFAATSHNFPVMAWSTVDGLLLVSLGVWLCLDERRKLVGYFLLGLACLCKQSFVFMPALVLIVFGDWRRAKLWAAIILPALFYAIFMALAGGLSDAVWQLTSRTNLRSTGIKTYATNWLVFAGVGYGIVAAWMPHVAPARWREIVHGLAWFVVPGFLIGLALYAGTIYLIAFLLFGVVAGAAIYALRPHQQSRLSFVRAAVLALGAAWSVSLSNGYNTPALASGALFMTAIANPGSQMLLRSAKSVRWLSIFAAMVFLLWGAGRLYYVYRDKSAKHLDAQLGEVLPGGRLIKTNARTHKFLADLQDAVAITERREKRYAIVPDVAAFWVKSKQRNPLPIEWPQWYEISNERNFDRLKQSLERARGSTAVLVQKVQATTLAEGFQPLPDDHYYAIVGYVRRHLEKVAETQFFDVYE